MSVLRDIQTGLQERLQDATLFDNLNYFSDVIVLTEDKGDIVNEINRALARLGICAVILMVDADNEHPNTNPPYLSNIIIGVEVMENVPINRAPESYKTINDVVEHVMLYGNHFRPEGVNEVLVLDKQAVRSIDNPPPGASVARMVRFRTSAGIQLSS